MNGVTKENSKDDNEIKKNLFDASAAPVPMERTIVACNGSVIELYPGFHASCQSYLDALIEHSGGAVGAVELAVANESSLRGAAVAVAVIDAEC